MILKRMCSNLTYRTTMQVVLPRALSTGERRAAPQRYLGLQCMSSGFHPCLLLLCVSWGSF